MTLDYGELENMNEDYKAAKISTGFGVPDGVYQVRIDEAFGEWNDRKDCNRLVIVMRVISGDHRGAKTKKRTDINPKTIQWIKSDFARIGIQPPEELTEIESALELMIGRMVEINAVSKEWEGKMYQNVYINRELGVDEVAGLDDLPF